MAYVYTTIGSIRYYARNVKRKGRRGGRMRVCPDGLVQERRLRGVKWVRAKSPGKLLHCHILALWLLHVKGCFMCNLHLLLPCYYPYPQQLTCLLPWGVCVKIHSNTDISWCQVFYLHEVITESAISTPVSTPQPPHTRFAA